MGPAPRHARPTPPSTGLNLKIRRQNTWNDRVGLKKPTRSGNSESCWRHLEWDSRQYKALTIGTQMSSVRVPFLWDFNFIKVFALAFNGCCNYMHAITMTESCSCQIGPTATKFTIWGMKTSCFKWLIISNNASRCCRCRSGRTACFNLEHATSPNRRKGQIEDKHFGRGPIVCGLWWHMDAHVSTISSQSTLFVVEEDCVDPPGSTAISAQFQNSSPNFSLLQQLFSSGSRQGFTRLFNQMLGNKV